MGNKPSTAGFELRRNELAVTMAAAIKDRDESFTEPGACTYLPSQLAEEVIEATADKRLRDRILSGKHLTSDQLFDQGLWKVSIGGPKYEGATARVFVGFYRDSGGGMDYVVTLTRAKLVWTVTSVCPSGVE
jgi:hypothetical protein